jgi:putative hemolysin
MNRRTLVLFLLTVTFGLLLGACQPSDSEPTEESTADLANPASVYCQEQGGTVQIRLDTDGGSYGVCVFGDGSECEEWAFVYAECRPGMYEQAEQGMRPARINVVHEAGLSEVTVLEILALNTEEIGVPYSTILTIDDQQSLREIIDALDVDIEPGLAVQCIPLYQLHFHLLDGSVQQLEYSCGDNQATFLRGDQPFIDGRDFRPPSDFNELMMRHIHSTWAQRINPARDLELSQTVHFEVLETVITSVDSDIVSAKVVSRLKIDDAELIAPLIAALDVDHEFTDGDPCAMRYVLKFELANGTENLGYFCRDGDLATLRGDTDIWHGRVIHASSDFREQFDLLVNQP